MTPAPRATAVAAALLLSALWPVATSAAGPVAHTTARTTARTPASTTQPPACATRMAPPCEATHAITVARGDSLIGLGRRLLVDPAKWPELARSNGLRNPHRLAIGATVHIPQRLMQVLREPATVLSASGSTRGPDGRALHTTATVAEGSEISTGPDGNLSIRLVDGTLLRLRSNSRLHLSTSRRLPAADAVQSGVRLEQGRVEVEAARAPAGRPGFSLETPRGVLGVRGTEFRVAFDAEHALTRGEVLGGLVQFAGQAATPGRPVPAGHGTLISAQGQVAPPVRLLPRPNTSAMPTLLEQLPLRFALAPLPGARIWRVQLASEPSFDRVLAEHSLGAAELVVADWPDGDYVLRLRGVDAQGLEGLDADHRFRLKAQPLAPAAVAPAAGAELIGERIEFTWSAPLPGEQVNANASASANAQPLHYRLQLARDASFSAPLHDLRGLLTPFAVIDGLAPGHYHWRLASVRAGTDQGPWGAPRSLLLRARPAVAVPAPPPPPPPPPAAPPPVVEPNCLRLGSGDCLRDTQGRPLLRP